MYSPDTAVISIVRRHLEASVLAGVKYSLTPVGAAQLGFRLADLNPNLAITKSHSLEFPSEFGGDDSIDYIGIIVRAFQKRCQKIASLRHFVYDLKAGEFSECVDSDKRRITTMDSRVVIRQFQNAPPALKVIIEGYPHVVSALCRLLKRELPSVHLTDEI